MPICRLIAHGQRPWLSDPLVLTVNNQARILIVDDFAPWRTQVRSLLLKARPEWHIIGEASDGQEAVEKASQLEPDIILLDLTMPRMNGIEAAKIINQRCPNAKIVFVTQDGDTDIRDAAMGTGAVGYLLKTNAVHELVDVITAALHHP
jgi:two-component system NarL family response regulator